MNALEVSSTKVVPNLKASPNDPQNKRERLEFSALPTSDIPGQTNDNEDDDDDDDDDDARSVANDSFTTAASTLSLGDICKG